MKFGTVLTALALESVSAHWGVGWCDPFGPETVKDFKVDDYAGNWYQIESDKDGFGKGLECCTASYKYNKDAWWSFYPVEVRNRCYVDSKVQSGDSIFGWPQAWARCTWGNGNCNVKFAWYPEGTYMVLDTDYTTKSLVYNCDTWFGLFFTSNAWIIGRSQSLSSGTLTSLHDTFKSKVSNWAYPIDD